MEAEPACVATKRLLFWLSSLPLRFPFQLSRPRASHLLALPWHFCKIRSITHATGWFLLFCPGLSLSWTVQELARIAFDGRRMLVWRID